MKKNLLAVLVVLFWMFSVPSASAGGILTPIAKINRAWVSQVWDFRLGGDFLATNQIQEGQGRVFVRNFRTGALLFGSISPGEKEHMAMSPNGRFTVWADSRYANELPNNRSIYVFDALTGEETVVVWAGMWNDHANPAVGNDGTVVWFEQSNGEFIIRSKNLFSGSERVLNRFPNANLPRKAEVIYGRIMIVVDRSGWNGTEIYIYAASDGTLLDFFESGKLYEEETRFEEVVFLSSSQVAALRYRNFSEAQELFRRNIETGKNVFSRTQGLGILATRESLIVATGDQEEGATVYKFIPSKECLSVRGENRAVAGRSLFGVMRGGTITIYRER